MNLRVTLRPKSRGALSFRIAGCLFPTSVITRSCENDCGGDWRRDDDDVPRSPRGCEKRRSRVSRKGETRGSMHRALKVTCTMSEKCFRKRDGGAGSPESAMSKLSSPQLYVRDRI